MGKNMKAQTFLEWCKDKPSLDYFGRKIFDIVDFYSQPFKPEMITELFGWIQMEKWNEYAKRFDDNRGHSIRFKSSETYNLGTYDNHGEPISDSNLIKPKTPNDFISDCNRAGIELEFKPEIVKEYFA